MTRWVILLVLGFTSAVPRRRAPIREVLPPWGSHRDEQHIPIKRIPAFQRGPVESPPFEDFQDEPITDEQEYGSQRYPLRDAVEALPANVLGSKIGLIRNGQEERVPLRDAVEHREAPFLGGIDQESIWIEPLAPPTLRRTQQIPEPKVVCHLDSGAVYRSEPFSLLPRALPDHRCTHLIYGAATIDSHDLIVVPRDPEYDLVKGGYKAAVGLRSRDPALRVLISISSPDRGRLFAEIVNNRCLHCQTFSDSILKFLREHDFDGVEIDWENSAEHSEHLELLLKTISDTISDKGFIVTVSVRPEDPINEQIATIADLIFLKAWRDVPAKRGEQLALHPAPLKFVVKAAGKWIQRVGSKRALKIILGVPVFGQSYTLKFGNFTDAGAPVIGPGIEGAYTKQHNGRLAYYETCEKLEEVLWISGRDKEGPYVKRGDQWIGYEDPLSVKIKGAYVRSAGLGGISLWSLDLDDFQGICGDPWPMLNAAAKTLGFYEGDKKKCRNDGMFSDPDNCSGFFSCSKGVLHHGHCGFGRFFSSAEGRCRKATPEICKPGQSDRIVAEHGYPARETQKLEHLEVQQNGPRVVCYVTSWALYRKGDGKFVPEHLDARLCTDVVYAFAGLNPESLMIQSFDPWADIENNLYQRVTSVKGPRILLAIGGWTDSSGDKYSRLISNGASRRKFVASVLNFLRKHEFDGLSFEWNYPKCWQSDCRKGPESDKPNFTKLVQELRKEFDKQEPRLSLAVALSGYKEVIDSAYEIGEISRVVDFMSVMTYDYHGAWESKSGHLAPLYASEGDSNPYYNVDFTMNYLAKLGAEKSKLLVGIPLYGQAYRLSNVNRTGLGDPTTGPGLPGEFTRQPGMLAYYEICNRIKTHNWQKGPGPSAFYKDQWVGYEDSESITAKGKYILQNGYGGATMWTVDLDDFLNRCCQESYPLLKSVNRALGRLLTPPTSTEDCSRPEEPMTPQPPTLTMHSDAIEGNPRPTSPMTTTTTKPTTWPTWTEKPTSTTQKTTWPTWTQRPTKVTEQTTKTSTVFQWTEKPEQSTVSWTWSTSRAPTTESTVTTRPPTETVTSGTGKVCVSGQYLPDPANCGNYYRCVLGELRREHCAPGLHWDTKRGLCDWPSIAKCQKTEPVPTTHRPSWTTPEKTTPSTTTSTTTTQSPITTSRPIIIVRPTQRPQKECEHGQYYAYPDSCTNFLICVNGNLVSQQCGPGLNWNREKNMCDWAFKNPCVDKPRKNALLVTKESTPSTCVPGSYTSVPGDCKRYQACLWGRHETFSCAPGLHFNKVTHICDWPARANCQDDEETEQVTKPTTKVPDRPSKPSEKPTRPPYLPVTSTMKTTAWAPSTTQATTLPSAEVDPGKVSPLSGYYKVVCYFTNWAWYRRGIGRYLPEHIDHTLCTHIVYGFAVLDYSDLVIKAHDSWADFDNKFYERVVAYKKRGLKVLLALGGWNDSAGDKYSRLVNNPASRKKFINHAIQFIEKYGFDGLDLDWEYPVCWQVDCKKGPASDKEGFASLLKELKTEFKSRKLLLTAAVSPSKRVIDKGYDVPALAKYLDWIAVMAYDYHGQWDKRTGHVAPLYYHPDDEFYYFNANYSIHYWISQGAPPRSIVMGMPLYGQSFTINDPSAGTGLNVPASAGNAGEFTRAAGFLSYYEICDRVRNRGWTVVQDKERRMGPYAYKGSQWVSFDDQDMIRQKAQFIRDLGLGGGMVWALDLDDFRGRCSDGPHPLLHEIQRVLASPPDKHDKPMKPVSPGVSPGGETESKPVTITYASSPVVASTQPTTTQQFHPDEEKRGEFIIPCYFTNWAWYRQNYGKYLPKDIDPDLCTHIIYGFAVLDSSALTIKAYDPWADLDNKFYELVVKYKEKGLKVLIAIGGWNDSAGNKYSRLVNSPASRRKFISQVIRFIEKYGFDGLDLDWEYPVCWQVDCKKGPSSDKENFGLLVKELSAEFKPRGLLLSAAVSPSKRVVDAGYDVPTLAKYLDWISVMAYDYHGQWDKKTGHVAPLYSLPNDWEPTFNANFSVHYWMEKGAPPKKLVMGVPLYGQSFSLAERKEHGLNVPTYGGGEAGEATRARGFLSYYEICERTLQKGWTVVQDKERRIGPYAYKGDQWVSFDDAEQIRRKAEFIKSLGLAGGMIWALDLDDFRNRCGCEPYPLLRTLNRVLRNYPKGPVCPVAREVTMIDVAESTSEVTTSTTSQPAYLPPVTTTTAEPTNTIDIDDTIEIDAVSPPAAYPPIGDCGGRLFIPHEKDCSKYLVCNFGKLSEHACPNGLYWNKDRCDWPENTKCKNGDRKNSIALVTGKNEGKVICYYTNWAWKRPGAGKFLPENIEADLCTHVVYGFAVLDPEQLTMKMQDPVNDLREDLLEKIKDIRSRSGVKVLIALGGWKDSKDNKYSKLAESPSARKRFAQQASQFVEKHGFDGLDIIWEYPVCWQVDCNSGPRSDKQSFSHLIKETSSEFKRKGLLLSVGVSPSKEVIDLAYDVPSISRHVDWIGIMAYDYHGFWDGKTGHVSPLYQFPGDDEDRNANSTIAYWIEKGAPARKLVLGVPAYGNSFSTIKNGYHGGPAHRMESSGPGRAGRFTKSAGFLSFYEICENVKNNGWTVTKDIEGRIGPYAMNRDQWISYDDVSSVVRKAQFINDLDLGGGMLWTLDLDDFKNHCGCGRYPLLKALNLGLRAKQDHNGDCT